MKFKVLIGVFTVSLFAITNACFAAEPVKVAQEREYIRIGLPDNVDYIRPQLQTDAIDLALLKPRRTWSVFRTDGDPNLIHVAPGHAFRTQMVGADLFFVPLSLLRASWGLTPHANIKLKKVDSTPSYYCGHVSIPSHTGAGHKPNHVLFLRPSDDEPDVIFLEFEEDKDPNQCMINTHHGGSAHAEN